MAVVIAKKWPVIPTGEYAVQVVNIEEVPNQFEPDKQQFMWTLEILNGEFKGKQVKMWTNASDSLKSNFIKYAGACLGQPIQEGESVDTNNLIGRQCVAVIVVQQKNDGENSKVMELKAPKKPRPVPPTAQAAARPVAGVTGSTGRAAQSEDDYDPFDNE